MRPEGPGDRRAGLEPLLARARAALDGEVDAETHERGFRRVRDSRRSPGRWRIAAALGIVAAGAAFAGARLTRPGRPPAEPSQADAAPRSGSTGSARSRVSRSSSALLAGPCRHPHTDAAQLAPLESGARSHWLQPWRGYLDTWPATRLRDAVGFHVGADGGEFERARLFARAGARRALVGVGWDSMDFTDPRRLREGVRRRLRERLAALRTSGLRPSLALSAHAGRPGPVREAEAQLLEPATRGTRTLRVAPGDVAKIVVGRTGLDSLTGYRASEVLITEARPDGSLSLSAPLPIDLPAGRRRITTLRFAPLRHVPGGEHDPEFDEAARGWIAFVAAVLVEARDVLGPAGFDLILGQPLDRHAEFFDADAYLGAPSDRSAAARRRANAREILRRTLAALAPGGSVPAGLHVPVIDGFAEKDPGVAGSSAVPGVRALARHLNPHHYSWTAGPFDTPAVDALGAPNGARAADGSWIEAFTPDYRVFFPEAHLTSLEPERAIVADLAPLPTTGTDGVVRGRFAHPPGGAAPALWVSAISLNATSARLFVPGLTDDDLWRWKAKATLRVLSAYVGKGAEALFLYDAHRDVALVDQRARDGGPVLSAVGRFLAAFDGARAAPPRAITLEWVGDCSERRQFDGDGSDAHPPLRDRDVLAFFPFQVDERKFVTATYLMTRNMLAPDPEATSGGGAARFDVPPQRFALAIAGIDGRRADARARDPLTGAEIPVVVLDRSETRIVVDLPVTDSPRLLTLEER